MAKIDWREMDGNVTSVERQEGRGGPIYTVAFNYKVDGHWYGGTFSGYEEYEVGDSVPVRYDPNDPDQNDWVQKEKRVRWIITGVVLIVLLVGLLVVLH